MRSINESGLGLSRRLITAGRIGLGSIALISAANAVSCTNSDNINRQSPLPEHTSAEKTPPEISGTQDQPPRSTGEYWYTELGLTFRHNSGKTFFVPYIPGLYSRILENNGVQELIYFTEKDNQYGLPENIAAGEFIPDIEINHEITGGVRLKDSIAEKLLDGLATDSESHSSPIIVYPNYVPNYR